MKNFYTEEQWNEILKQQESVLCYDTFTRKQALELGLLIAEVTEKKYHGSVAVRIVEDETTVFAYKMEGATLEADWWMTNKLAASRLTGMSSLRALTASRAGELEASWKVSRDAASLLVIHQSRMRWRNSWGLRFRRFGKSSHKTIDL